MRILHSPVSEGVLVYATQTRTADYIRPSSKRSGLKGEDLFWMPVAAVKLDTGERIDLGLFSTAPVPVRALDVLDVDGLQLLDVSGGRYPVGLYQTEHVRVIGNLLDAMRSSMGDLTEVADE